MHSTCYYDTAGCISRCEESVLQPCKLLAWVAECVEQCIVVHGATKGIEPDKVCLVQHVWVLDCVFFRASRLVDDVKGDDLVWHVEHFVVAVGGAPAIVRPPGLVGHVDELL